MDQISRFLKAFADGLSHDGVKFLITTIGLSAAFIVGILQYIETAKRDYKKPFLAKQLELCLSASQSAARFANTTSQTESETARIRFLELYWGGLAMVEDQCVTAKMIDFKIMMGAASPTNQAKQQELAHRALEIAFACRHLISKSWSDIGALDWRGATKTDQTDKPNAYAKVVADCAEIERASSPAP